MMNMIVNPDIKSWDNLCERPVIASKQINSIVEQIFKEVESKGDEALKKYTHFFDGVDLQSLVLNLDGIDEKSLISQTLQQSILHAKSNIEKFHLTQIEQVSKIKIDEGITCWRESRPIDKVGLYIPGGTAPLFSTILMLGIPAKIAGCKEIILCTPPDKNGEIHPAILFTAKILGIKQVFCVGGIQAIAAMVFGTESVPKVYKIFGPGNQYVTAAKQMAHNKGVAIDMPAGPSELLAIADETAIPSFLAADLLSQAEHGVDSQVVLVSTSQNIINETIEEIKLQTAKLPRKKIVEKSLLNSKFIYFDSMSKCVNYSNHYAPEHLIVAAKDFNDIVAKIDNAGSVFLGNYSCESVGDYASGTNHTLPTNGYARNYSGVSLDSFVKKKSHFST
jgi:histidinol dehydrogenase